MDKGQDSQMVSICPIREEIGADSGSKRNLNRRSAVSLNGYSDGLKHSRRLILNMSAMRLVPQPDLPSVCHYNWENYGMSLLLGNLQLFCLKYFYAVLVSVLSMRYLHRDQDRV